MDEREQKRGGGSGCAIGCLLMFFLLPMLYLLGLGPAVWMSNRYPATMGFWQLVYAPFGFLHEHSQVAREVLDWYVQFWE